MTSAEALHICRLIESDWFTDKEKEKAIQIILETETSKVVTRPEFVRMIKYLIEKCQIYKTGIDELGLSVRTYNCLRKAGMNTIGDLCSRTPEDIIKIKNLGKRSFTEILETLKERGLQLKAGNHNDSA